MTSGPPRFGAILGNQDEDPGTTEPYPHPISHIRNNEWALPVDVKAGKDFLSQGMYIGN